MAKEKLFSIIILHYNQEKYIKTAIDSVLMQNYENIELIITDDYSNIFDVEKWENYIKENSKINIANLIVLTNETNVGTVKNLNNAIKKASGKYLMFFAADDALYDENTINNFVKGFAKLSNDKFVISSQCMMYDNKLKKIEYEYVNVFDATKMNSGSSKDQYKKMMFKCCFAAGATAFKREVFEKYGLFNEKYKIIEDWSYFNYLNRSGVLITYCDFGGLKHRDGGVSHYDSNDLPDHVIAYKDDLLRIMEDEIIPYISILPIDKQLQIMYHYDVARKEFFKIKGSSNRKKRVNMIFENPQIYISKFFNYSHQVIGRLLRFFIRSWIFSSICMLSITLLISFFQTTTTHSWLINQIINAKDIILIILTYIFVLSIFYILLYYIYRMILLLRRIYKRFFAKGE